MPKGAEPKSIDSGESTPPLSSLNEGEERGDGRGVSTVTYLL